MSSVMFAPMFAGGSGQPLLQESFEEVSAARVPEEEEEDSFSRMASKYSQAVFRLKDALSLAQYGSPNLREIAAAVEADEYYHGALCDAVYRLQDLARLRMYRRRARAATVAQRLFRGHRVRRPTLYRSKFRQFVTAENRVAEVRRSLAARSRWKHALLVVLGLFAAAFLQLCDLWTSHDLLVDHLRMARDRLARVEKDYEDRTIALEIRLHAALERSAHFEEQAARLENELNHSHTQFQTLLNNVARIERTWPFFSLFAGLDVENLLRVDHRCGHSPHCTYKLLQEDLSRQRMRRRQQRDDDHAPNKFKFSR